MPDCNHSLVRPLLPIIQYAQNDGKINLQKTKKKKNIKEGRGGFYDNDKEQYQLPFT